MGRWCHRPARRCQRHGAGVPSRPRTVQLARLGVFWDAARARVAEFATGRIGTGLGVHEDQLQPEVEPQPSHT